MSSNSKSIYPQRNLNAANPNAENDFYEFDNFRLDVPHLMLYQNGQPVSLAPKVVETLLALVERPNEIVGKEELMKRLWADSFVEEANLTQNIYLLRKTLGKSADGQDLIEGFRRRGYRFNGQIKTANRTNDKPSVTGRTHPHGVFNSLAVLPLKNESADANAEYLSDGITESIINRLSQVRELRVVARATAFRYKGQDAVPQEVGRDLGVSAVLTGRVLQLGDSLIIRTELVDAANGWQIWGEQYNRLASDILELQETIAREISENLQLKLSGEEQKRLTMRYTESTEAYHLYIKGRFHLNKRLTETIEKAAAFFQQAIDADPTFAPAYVGLADCYPLLSLYGELTPQEAYPKAKSAALKALEIDNGYTKAYNSLGVIKLFYEWDWAGAESAFKQAIELNRGYPDAHQRYGMLLTATGRFDEATAEFKRARDLDPLSLITKTISAYPFYYSREYEMAKECFREVIDLDENYSMAHFRLGLTYAQQGLFKEAIAELQISTKLSNDRDSIAALGYVQGLAGNISEAQNALNELDEREKSGFVSSYNRVLINVGMGKTDTAMDWLERAYEERSYWLIYVKVDPALDPLRTNTRFIELQDKIFSDVKPLNLQSDGNDSDAKVAVFGEAGEMPKSNNQKWFFVTMALILLGLFILSVLALRYFSNRNSQAQAVPAIESAPPANLNVTHLTPDLRYSQMSEDEQLAFVKEQTRRVQAMIGDETTDLSEQDLQSIKTEVDDYAARINSLSQEPFEEGLRVIYGRACQFAPTVSRSYNARRVPPALGIYQAMIESEYHDCLINPAGPVGLFQFSRKTAAKYDLIPKDYCNIEKQSDAAARYMADLLSDFDNQKSLSLLAFNIGETGVRDYLRQLREQGVTERSSWAIFQHRQSLQPPPHDEMLHYVPRFFAAAIIGENPATFDLPTPALSTLY